ncbi:MAG TPA: hypothetical protein ENI64_09045 [Gammaproteobacteria bacterium]|nr:hypothetical protein [Gammaproteobacteria bacterium]
MPGHAPLTLIWILIEMHYPQYNNRLIMATFTACLLWSNPLLAEDLNEIYQLARQQDPQLKAAVASREAAYTARPQALAGLLPHITFRTNADRIKQDSSLSGSSVFNNTGYDLSLTQPVFNYRAIQQYRQSDFTLRQADATYGAAVQELILRVSESYFNVLAAGDNVEFARTNKAAIARQREQARKRFEVGLIAITDVHEAEALYDQAVATEIAAINEQANSLETLNVITGAYHEQLHLLQDTIPLVKPDPEGMDKWTDISLKQNLSLQAANAAVEIAKKSVDIRKADHLPTVDMVLSTRNQDVGGDFAREFDTDSISVQLSVPIYSGGLTSAQVNESAFLLQQSRQQAEFERRSTVAQTRNAYRGVLTGISQVLALEKSIISTRSALETTEAGFEVGTRTIVDVLNSQRLLFQTKRDLARTRYDYILNYLRLKRAAGTLSPDDILRINKYLTVSDNS